MPDQSRIVPTPAASDLPGFTLLAGGTAVASTYQVVSVQVSKGINRISEAEIVVLDGDVAAETFAASDSDVFIPGTALEIKAGYHGIESTIFKGVIVKQAVRMMPDDASVMILTLKHEAYKLAAAPASRVFADSTDSNAIETILGEYGIIHEVTVTTFSHEHLVQYAATDWDFIVMRAEAAGLVVVCTTDGIAVIAPEVKADADLKLYHGASLLEFEAEMDGRNSFKSIRAQRWDAPSAEMQNEEASANTLTGGNISTARLSRALAIPPLVLSSAPVSAAESEGWASGTAVRMHLSKIRGRAKCIGFAEIEPGGTLELAGVGARFNGNAFVAGVSHTLAAGRWDTDLQFGMDFSTHAQRFGNISQPPAGGLLPPVSGLQIGLVMSLEDPQSEDRVLVRLPTLSAEEAVWARISLLDAGNGRGSFFRPEVGDEVVLGFLANDPRAAILLGGLHSSHSPAPVRAADTNHTKGFYTREGMKLVFDDEKKAISIETPAGNKITISDDDKGIILTDQNGNRITLTGDGIEVKSSKDLVLKAGGDIMLEGMNIEAKASLNFKAEGQAGASLKSSAITEVKGAMVNVN